ncbi:HNH endonuclease [Pelomonas sp. BJYL3]|uniref:HNH endonuclease n=1 Tax=Pelomonas sp. BJYL3 TaxID=2976697 RepID=UPI0022B4B1F6|nr:HNH endonuclease [Pelomonas sp. BJYL3]
MTKSRHIRAPKAVWSEVDLELLRRNFADSLTADLAKACGKTLSAVQHKARQMGLRKSPEFIASTARERAMSPGHGGERTRFVPGAVPANKGLRRPGYAPGNMGSTQFKAGRPASEARNYLPIGSHRINADGHVERKVTDDPSIYPARRWQPVYRLVWEAAHGPIPAGHLIRFKPGMATTDPELITADKLECISRRAHMLRHTFHQYGPEVAAVVQLRGAITRQINKRSKEK